MVGVGGSIPLVPTKFYSNIEKAQHYMPIVTLPDGSQKEFDQAVSVTDVVASIGAGLAKAALAAQIDDRIVDLDTMIDRDVTLQVFTAKSEQGLEVIRHSTAHLLAQAVKQLFPSAQVTIGPVIDDGFYYDFAFERAFTPDDLVAIEARMKVLVKENLPIVRHEMTRAKAIERFRALGEEYKVEIISDIPESEILSVYSQGDFEDLCRGPHVPSTGHLKVFKLTKVAGAYWRGDSKNVMLQRIYGTAWPDKKALKTYLYRLEEAQKRDHRKLGKRLGLFHFQPEAPGMAFWHPKGWTVYQIIQHYIRQVLPAYGYQEVNTPQVVSRSLWEQSGHWEMFGEEMFTTQIDEQVFAIKPMSCPCHIQIFKQGIKSYRDLPVRLAEFGNCHRCEPSGALHGLLRVRNMVQDDAHIFCTEEQIQSEVTAMIRMVFEVYADFGFTDIAVKLATRPEKRVGSDAIWDKAEESLTNALNDYDLDWQLLPDEGAFYGPKIEFHLKDCLGRVWQCGTIQVDFAQPERLGATYIDEKGEKHVPVMLHRAILGTLERFLGILIEHYAGWFPAWLAPVQVAVLPITDAQADYAEDVLRTLQKSGVRALSDLRNEKISFKIREHTLQHVPYLLVVGDREVESGQVAVRASRQARDVGSMTVENFIEQLHQDVSRKGRTEEE